MRADGSIQSNVIALLVVTRMKLSSNVTCQLDSIKCYLYRLINAT